MVEINYELGDVSAIDIDEDRDHKRWRFMQLMSLVTMLLVIWVGHQSYRQGKDREVTDKLVNSSQVRDCEIRAIRESIPPETKLEAAFLTYYRRADTELDCADVSSGKH